MNTPATTRDNAVALAQQGMYVFPLKPRSKQPATVNGLKDGSCDPDLVEAMFAPRWDGLEKGIGIDCGRSGLLVIDLDGEEGMSQAGLFPATLSVVTGKGMHLYYGTATPLKSTVRALGPGIDTRGDGGYVVAPPSIHPDGHRYQWADGTRSIEPVPSWVADRLRKRPKPKRHRKPSPEMRSVLIWSAVERLRATTEGGRNNALNRECYGVRDCEDHKYLAILFVSEGEALGLPREECIRTVASALGDSTEEVESWL